MNTNNSGTRTDATGPAGAMPGAAPGSGGPVAAPLRWGILGWGKIARTQLSPAMQQAGHQVVHVGSRTPGQALPEWPQARRGDYDAVLADPAVDAVYIALPNHLHVPWTVRALRAGKAVLCEKPMALSLDELAEVQAAARDTGRLVHEAFMVGHHPQWHTVRALARQSLGSLRMIQVAFAYNNQDAANIRNAYVHGGGGLWDIGCYAVWVGQWLMGREPDRVSLRATIHPEWGTDIHSHGELHWSDGPTVLQFFVSTQSAPHQSVRLLGTSGWAEVAVPFNAEPVTRLLYRAAGGVANQSVETLQLDPVNQYAEMVKDFAQALAEGRPSDLSQTAAITRTLLRLRESAGQR